MIVEINLILLFLISQVSCFIKKPNIVIFFADDMGRNDVGIHGSSQIPTPNIDALGYNGVILNRHYTLHSCTPSRSALLTGNHPIRAGMQGFPLRAGEPRALPFKMPTMAEKLLGLGYNTHIVGKWHVGHQNRSVTPLGRGFQTHLGYWSGFMGYFDYEIFEGVFNGYDMHKNHQPSFEYNGTYATDLFTKEAIKIIKNHNPIKPMFLYVSHLAVHTGKNGDGLEVPNPAAANKKYSYITNSNRRLYADMMNRLDTSVGKVVKALYKKKMLRNTIILFMSDNGAPTVGLYANSGSNWPLRGIKLTLYEGGVRNVAIIWSTLLKNRHYVENTLFHITDWLPTLYAAAGGNVADLGKIDGINHWPLLSKGKSVERTKDVLLNIDEVENYSAILSSDGHYKLTQGVFLNGTYDGYFGDSGRENSPPYDTNLILNSDVNRSILKTIIFSPLVTNDIYNIRNQLQIKQLDAKRENLTCNFEYCLFDLWKDPTETTNILNKQSEIALKLNESLNAYRKEMIPQTNKPVDVNSNPAYCYNTWFTWLDPVIKCTI